MQTTAAIERAKTASVGDRIPSDTKIKHVSARVATVMPEIGLDDEPISPVRRDETVTKRKPNANTKAAPRTAVQGLTSVIRIPAKAMSRTKHPIVTTFSDISCSVRRC